MKNVFGQKKIVLKKFCRTRAAGQGPARPKGGPDRSVGASNPSKTIRRTQKPWKSGVFWPCNSLCSQNYAQNTFLGHFGRFGGRLGPTGAPGPRRGPPKHKIQKSFTLWEIWAKKIFRLLNNPKRLGLGQKVPEKYTFRPNGVQFMVSKIHVFLSIYIHVCVCIYIYMYI